MSRKKIENEHYQENKEPIRKQLEKDIEEYLSKGGGILELPPNVKSVTTIVDTDEDLDLDSNIDEEEYFDQI